MLDAFFKANRMSMDLKRRFGLVPEDTSQFGEGEIIAFALSKIKAESDFVIDIGASDGMTGSNTYPLFSKGHPGIAIEAGGKPFANLAINLMDFNVILHRCKVTPDNILQILESDGAPKQPLYLNLDIDSYDYYVLKSILKKYRPSLITAEINEIIPPGIMFTVLPESDIEYTPGSHFAGMSISLLGDLCEEFAYDLHWLNYINAFLIPKELNNIPALTPEFAYQNGYQRRPDRKQKFPWNADVEELQGMSAADGVFYLNNLFREYEGKYLLWWK